MKSFFLSLALVGMCSTAFAVAAAPSGPAPRSDGPVLTGTMKAALAARPAKTCKAGPIAVYARGEWSASAGSDSPLVFGAPAVNDGGGWENTPSFSSFTAPCSGVYHLSVGFTRSAYPTPRCGAPGTNDDIYVYLTVDGTALPMRRAWTGEGDGMRATASSDTVVHLNKDQTVMVWVSADTGRRRCLAEYSFTGFKFADLP